MELQSAEVIRSQYIHPYRLLIPRLKTEGPRVYMPLDVMQPCTLKMTCLRLHHSRRNNKSICLSRKKLCRLATSSLLAELQFHHVQSGILGYCCIPFERSNGGNVLGSMNTSLPSVLTAWHISQVYVEERLSEVSAA